MSELFSNLYLLNNGKLSQYLTWWFSPFQASSLTCPNLKWFSYILRIYTVSFPKLIVYVQFHSAYSIFCHCLRSICHKNDVHRENPFKEIKGRLRRLTRVYKYVFTAAKRWRKKDRFSWPSYYQQHWQQTRRRVSFKRMHTSGRTLLAWESTKRTEVSQDDDWRTQETDTKKLWGEKILPWRGVHASAVQEAAQIVNSTELGIISNNSKNQQRINRSA